MKIEEIKKELFKNGGYTIGLEKKEGFMVSIYGAEKTILLKDINKLDEIIKEYQKKIENKKNMYIGLWIHENKIYIDISKCYKSKYQAIKKGVENKQLSIYDIENDSYIELLKNVYILYKYNKINNDIQYIKEFNSIDEIKKDFNIKNVYDYIINNIDEEIKHLLYNDYIIIKDKIEIEEI